MSDERSRPLADGSGAADRVATPDYVMLAERLRTHISSLLDLLRERPLWRHDLMRTLAEVARISSKALQVERTSVWLFTEQGTLLTCKLLLVNDRERPTEDVSLRTAVSPAYFAAIGRTGVVAVEDVLDDPRTVGLEPYVRKHGVRALLDISIAIPGEVVGVVCHEHTHGPRVWRAEEIDFARHVGDLIALALEVERRQWAEAKARGSEAKYRYLVESLPVTVYSFQAYANKLEYLSPQARELGGFDPDEFLGGGVSAWLDVIHPDDRAQVQARFAPGGVDRVPAEIYYRVTAPDGRIHHIRDHCRVVRNHAGEPLAIQGVLADVTEQRRAEARSAELERRFRTLLENVDLIALVLDCDGRAEFVNRCFERISGYSAEQVLGADCFALLATPESAEGLRARFLQNIRSASMAPRFETDLRTRSGEVRRILWTNTLLRNEDGKLEGVCTLGLDITDRVRFEAQLLQQTKLESMGQLAAGMAHDFNNLLTVITLEIEQLSLLHADTESQSSLDLIRQSLQQAAELTRSLLVYARREPIYPTHIDVDALVEEMAPLLSALAHKDVGLATSLHAAGAETVIDKTQLRQLLMNLVGNAVEATRDHGTQVVVQTAVEHVPDAIARARGASRGGQFVVVTVADDGRGMDKRTLTRALEPFFTTKESGKGTGLGLSMCQAIVQRAEGFFTVESEPGRGATCRAYLPRSAPSAAIQDPEPRRSGRITDALLFANALIVEDDPIMRELMLIALEPIAVHVQAVGTTQAAARIAASEEVDLLVTDGNLADGSGRVLARSLRAARPSLRVLLVSGSPEDAPEFDATLLKPFTSEDLRRVAADLALP